MGCDIVTVSRDTKFVHLAWRRYEKDLSEVKYTMASDVTGNVARMFGVLDEDSGLALRGAFLVNPEGTLLGAEINYYNIGRNVDELMRKFKANVHVAKKPTEVCPSKWKDEGDRTLIPTPDMVGRVGETT